MGEEVLIDLAPRPLRYLQMLGGSVIPAATRTKRYASNGLTEPTTVDHQAIHGMIDTRTIHGSSQMGVYQRSSGIILAGGQSSRMGVDKASLPWAESDILHAQLKLLTTVCSQLIVISNIPRNVDAAVRILPDNYPGCGPLGGIEAGLSAADNELCFVVACDMPFLETGSVNYLLHCIGENQAAVPCIDGRWHPLYAVYKKTCLPVIRFMLSQGRLRLRDLVVSLTVRMAGGDELAQFSPDLTMLSNLNTPQDWQACRTIECISRK